MGTVILQKLKLYTQLLRVEWFSRYSLEQYFVKHDVTGLIPRSRDHSKDGQPLYIQVKGTLENLMAFKVSLETATLVNKPELVGEPEELPERRAPVEEVTV